MLYLEDIIKFVYKNEIIIRSTLMGLERCDFC